MAKYVVEWENAFGDSQTFVCNSKAEADKMARKFNKRMAEFAKVESESKRTERLRREYDQEEHYRTEYRPNA